MDTNKQVDFKFDLLYKELEALYENTEGGTPEAPTSKTQILVMPENLDAPSKKAPIVDLLNDAQQGLGTIGIDLGPVNSAIDAVKGIDFFKTLSTELQTAFFYMVKETGKPDSREYAFSIALEKSSDSQTIAGLAFKKLSFSIWNTDKKQIINQMKLRSVDDIIKNLQNDTPPTT